MRRERKTLLTAQCLMISLRYRSVSISSVPPGIIDKNLTVGIDWQTVYIKSSSSLYAVFRLCSPDNKSLPLSPECHPPAAVRSVPLYDGPSPGPDGGYRDRKTLCLQPAGGGAHSGKTELALSQGHV